ncbi:phospholipase D family protein [Sulfitobacter sp. W002]|uniref:phospholipase D family protein n=1 Tax=Sulfitobacter sp. W002 TaxID=2867024 RepID=UPI0021A86934|nr:phospholipase D family protein [Sulfitobacter sp. W002]UWR31475.1 phospholipase D family protein [Sulfitobacter sp. W002]
MNQFLVSTNIDGGSSHHIKKILKGKDVRIASAFLGKGADEMVEGGTRLICDIGMGGTNPTALTALSEKLGKDNVKYLSGFHAKVYLSDKGCLVGSANLSSNGVGFLSHAKLIEAAIFVAPDDVAVKSASAWFEDCWKEAQVVGPEEIKWAETTWNLSKRGTPHGHRRYETFLEALEDSKSGVAGRWKFLLTKEPISKPEKDAIKIGEEEVIQKVNWVPQGGLDAFTGLSERKKLDGYYISLHRGGRGKLYLKALKFIGNLNLAIDDETKVKASYFSVLPWSETEMPPLSNDDLDKDGELSAAISKLKNKKFGHALDAKTFAKILRN